ncbi:transposase [Hymenobacter sp. UV11]|uniref:transposase n=1 Tax=Hymenobacter sp. UV11 TaxID=1849735 RepID=UPI001060FF7D|nr:transposase [Hymenobacter sp. UV11]TDN36872.1 hypothetical protein A8B98_06870 [Hymenobacter sp. UV11]TFZ66321.1 transposase [Hymenobacter sp. UV11]
MHFEAGQLYHVYNRGNNGQQLFFTPNHYLHFLHKLRAHIRPHCQLLAYCLMPNHFHLLLYATQGGTQPGDTPSSAKQPLTRGISTALSSYSQGLNKQLGNSGAVFAPKTKMRLVTGTHENYPRTCLHYLHQNPLRAGLVTQLAAWPYSSYRDYVGQRAGSLCNQDLARELLDLPLDHAAFEAESARAIDPENVKGWR